MNKTGITLKPGREKNLAHGHPWIFSGAVDRIDGVLAGDKSSVAEVYAADGTWMGRGLFNPVSQLAVRILTRDPEESVGEETIARRVVSAVQRRDLWFKRPEVATLNNSCRLVFSESDGLSGLIADRYAGLISVRFSTPWPASWIQAALDALRNATGCTRLFVAAESDAAEREGLDASALRVYGTPDGTETVAIRENGLLFEVGAGGGQKTGFYLDQRENRRLVAEWAKDRRVLSAYCYTGAFEVNAARAGAREILGLDMSASALEQAARHHQLNDLSIPVEYRKGDVPHVLRKFRDEGRRFDLIILDPPRFVFSKAQLEKGMRAYKDINLLAIKLLSPGGLLATFSCSGLVGPETFSTMLGWAAEDAGRPVRILSRLGQPCDHPILAGFPESEYLKGLLACVE